MSPSAKDLLANAMNLPENERAELAALLIESLESEPDDHAEVAWQSEIAQRISELDDGSVMPVPWPEARNMILGKVDDPSKS